MSDKNRHDWSNYWQGRTADQVGDAMVGVGVERSAELAAFWKNELSNSVNDARILDLACGAGSVLRHAQELGVGNLTGIDISADAIDAMQKNIPTAAGAVGPVDAMPFEDNSFSLVVSQFGFEYAGDRQNILATANEIGRVLKPDGRFVAICHAKDGGIEREVAGHLVAIADLERCDFIRAARILFEAVFALEADHTEQTKTAFQEASSALSGPRDEITAWLQTGMIGDHQILQLGQHLYSGAMDLYNRRKAYALEDITGWLDSMQAEIDAYKGRMASMQEAALDKDGCDAILAELQKSGFDPEEPKYFYMGDDQEPAAWILKAS